ncbi:hypothetical protein BD626DRAFT_410809 [Schizophyllum amplum]|uniref:Polysaccharide lyase family 7 protein n=1 Tax=Schizophyllum amplum TaxID=97359 RepID=A0A550C0C6_9AGAR|nr:hypothetical protein BD626DRAFT_410809 [Auriculariopsis ampla]
MKLQSALPVALASAAMLASAKVLNDGSKLAYGRAFNNQVQWQMSGVLETPCTGALANLGMSDCYQMSLSADGSKNLDTKHLDSPRQRNEFRADTQAAGETRTYTWKEYVSSDAGTSSNFFHLMQIFDAEKGAPVVTLTARKGQVALESSSLCNGDCPSAAWSAYAGRTTLHIMRITFGPSGSMDYNVEDAETGEGILSHSLSGALGGSTTYLKFGTYRKVYDGMTAVTAAAGDFTQS